MHQPVPFEIAKLPNGGSVATNGEQRLQAEPGATVFRRRGIKRPGTEAAEAVEWVVGELDGVRAYFDGTDVILTREDLYP